MIIGFFVVSCLLSLGLIVATVKLNKYEHVVRRNIQYLFIAAVVTILCNALSVLIDDVRIAALLHGLYFAATDWLVIVLMQYARRYTNIGHDNVLIRGVIYAGAVADTVSMAVNAWTGHVFVCEKEAFFGGECYGVSPVTTGRVPVYLFHLIFVYALAALVFIIFLYKLKNTIKLYRGKYNAVVGCFVPILLVNIGYRFLNIPVDISPILYTFLAVACVYFTLFYVPKSIVVKLLSLAVEDLENGIMCFDKDGKCVYANEMSRDIFEAHQGYAPLERYYTSWLGGRSHEELKECAWKEERILSDGEMHYFEIHFKFLLDNHGNYVGNFFSLMDRTEAYRELEMERYNATHDYLTDIYNRGRFFERVGELLKQAPDVKHVVVCIDVKDFKMVNDLFGEATGNQILKRIAGLMRRDASEDTAYGRLEADRFAMCMREENFHEEDYAVYLEDL
ncbi:MAG: diguanylate cyclase, partial [Butyrivibrio sp.]|nr:diguanylate cyclase [Butyrivibrio sp.]